jgi:hypothetical protein
LTPGRFADMPQRAMWEVVDALDAEIEADVMDDDGRALFLAVQTYALQLLEWLPPDDTRELGKPVVRLIGGDGNVFSIIGTVKRALANYDFEHGTDLATEFVARAFAAGSYDEVLRLTLEYCDVR